jgi:putative sugar O-methyltransferase
MSSKLTTSNNLWDLVLTDSLDLKKLDINSFRQVGRDNCRLGTWDAIDQSSRYYKSLLYSNAENIDRQILKSKLPLKNKKNGDGIRYYLKRIRNQNIGNPPTVNYFNNDISIDYLLSTEEMFFLDEILKKSTTVMEIGAGFGRLSHSIIQNFKNINRYIIVDLDEVLELAKIYMSKVLNEQEFSKIDFISHKNFKELEGKVKIDISINIDSFQEIDESVVLDYLKFISKNSNYFYTKNAIGKYDPDTVDIKLKNNAQIQSALNMGLCKDIIDIFDSNEIQKARLTYLKKFCPSNFKVFKHEACFGQYLYYYSALFKHN